MTNIDSCIEDLSEAQRRWDGHPRIRDLFRKAGIAPADRMLIPPYDGARLVYAVDADHLNPFPGKRLVELGAIGGRQVASLDRDDAYNIVRLSYGDGDPQVELRVRRPQ